MARRPYSPRAARRASSTRRVDGGEDLAGALEQHLAGGSELDAAGGAVEQRLAELGLEAADLLRERRLRDVQPRSGAAEVPLLGDGDEVAQVPELHGSGLAIHIQNIVNQTPIGVAPCIDRPTFGCRARRCGRRGDRAMQLSTDPATLAALQTLAGTVRITDIEAIPFALPYRRPPAFASGTVSSADNVLVRVHTRRRARRPGRGAAAPLHLRRDAGLDRRRRSAGGSTRR